MNIRPIHVNQIRDGIAAMCKRANFELSEDMRAALRAAAQLETITIAKNTLLRIQQNADVAQERQLPMCQDTGLVVVFADVGQGVQILGGTLRDAIDEGVRKGYKEGYLRASVTGDPIQRENTGDNTPAILYTELVAGDELRLQLLAKGGGCENMSRFKMLTPADGREGIVDFVVSTATLAGPNACPPIVVGVGIGGSFEYSAVLSKKSLLRRLGERSPLPHVAELEDEILEKINASGIGRRLPRRQLAGEREHRVPCASPPRNHPIGNRPPTRSLDSVGNPSARKRNLMKLSSLRCASLPGMMRPAFPDRSLAANTMVCCNGYFNPRGTWNVKLNCR